MENEEKLELRKLLRKYETTYSKSALIWRGGHRALLVFAAFLSTSAAIIGQFDYWKTDYANDLSSILAGLAAVITTLIAALNFEGNTNVNRKSRHEVANTILELEKTDVTRDKVIDKMQEIIKNRSKELVG